ncbi:MAG: sterol desaturase family protein [Pseudomonadota bacterium]
MTDASLRLALFIGIFAVLATLELAVPRRRQALSRAARWPGAFSLLLAGSVLGRLALPLGLAGVALWAEAHQLGIFHQIAPPGILVIAICFLVFDLSVWAQHVAMHRFGVLWRMHRVHHADPGFDVTTALRFHPAEILVSLAWKAAVVVSLGAPAAAVLWFEVALNAFAQFNHANIKLPLWLDRVLRAVIVTPDMHRVHHSVLADEHTKNFGFCLSLWDRLFGVYRAQPGAGHAAMHIGQAGGRARRDQRPIRLLLQPLEVELSFQRPNSSTEGPGEGAGPNQSQRQ